MSASFITSYPSQYTTKVYENTYGVQSSSIDNLFMSTTANTQANMDALAGTILGKGIDFFTAKNYTQAVKSFKQAAALSPSSNNASNAYNYLGQAYVKLEDTENAIKTYKEAIRLYPADDTFYIALGDLYLKQDDLLIEATEMYEQAVAINPHNAESQYSLGQRYLQNGELSKANGQFRAVVRISPANASGYYGLGQVARAEGDLTEALSWLTRAQSVDKDFELAYLELGSAYADRGEFSKAEDQLSILEAHNSAHSAALEKYITQVTPAKITKPVVSLDGFNTSLGPRTAVSALGSKLTEANKSNFFSLTFKFSKDMDASSVITSKNWTISRATLRNNGGVYNFGLRPPSTEAIISSTPAYVTFDETTNVARMYFKISQNENANATIDPKHIVFKFSGVDTYGKTMDSSADEYSGFSGIA